MTTKTLAFSIITAIFLIASSCNQRAALTEIDIELTQAFCDLMDSPNEEIRANALAPSFKSKMLENLKNPITFENPLDSLSKYVTIKSSSDKQVKFYSWDNQERGTWHSMEVLAQFKADNGKVIVQSVSKSDRDQEINYTDSEIYDIQEFSKDKTKYYLTFGRGTHGSGMQHEIVQIFRIEGDTLVKCTSCFTNNIDLVIEYPRADTLTLTFNPTTKEIKYSEVLTFEDNRFYGRPTKNIVTLVLDSGKFKTR